MEDNKDIKTFVLLDGSKTTRGFIVNVAGVDVSQFMRNPVMLYNHDSEALPIGVWKNIRMDEGRLLADADFDVSDESAEVKRIIGKVQRGFIKMCSAGLSNIVIEVSNGQTVIAKSRLREASITPLGANNNAMVLYDDSGASIDLDDEVKLSDFINKHKFRKMNKVIEFLNLSADSDEEAVLSAITNVQNERKVLSDKLAALEMADKTAKQAKFAVELDAAIKSGRLRASARENFLKLYEVNPELTAKTLADLPAPESASAAIGRAAATTNANLSALSAKSWDELDRSGELVVLRQQAPEVYKEKFKTKFGVEPSVSC
jgi:HK97 family phage prohead protease